MSSLILVVDDESDVEMLFRQQFRRDLSYGLDADPCPSCPRRDDALDAGVAVVCALPAAVVTLARYRGLVSSASITRRALG